MEQTLAKPTCLKPGDRVRLIATASPFDRALYEAGRHVLERFGLEPVAARGEFTRAGFLAGDDQRRADQLVSALQEADTQAVWCIRGGYGTARLLPLVQLPQLRRKPKLLIGFSDVTALLAQLTITGGFVAVHGPVVTQLARLPSGDLRWLKRLLFDRARPMRVPLGRTRTGVPGVADGKLVGGNLSILASLAGTPFAPDLRGTILCLEDVGEKAYRLDRLVWQLVSAGLLDDIRGIVVGQLVDCVPAGAGRYSARRVLEAAMGMLGVPFISGAAFGHGCRNVALPLGVQARLDADTGSLTLLEPAVEHNHHGG